MMDHPADTTSAPGDWTRRRFLAGLAAGVAGTAAADQPAPQPLAAEVEAQFQAILARHGARLSASQKVEVRKALVELGKAVEALRAFPLTDADEPALPFRVYRKPGGAP
jgi:hypothetical protein